MSCAKASRNIRTLSDGKPSSCQCRPPCTGTWKTGTNGNGAVSGNMPPLASPSLTKSLAFSKIRPCLTWLHALKQTLHLEIERTSHLPSPGSMRSWRVRLNRTLPALELSHQTQFIYDSGTQAIGARAFTSSCKALKVGEFFRVSAGSELPSRQVIRLHFLTRSAFTFQRLQTHALHRKESAS